MDLDHITEEFALTVLRAAIDRNGVMSGKKLKEVVSGAVQICIDADRAVKDYLSGRVTITGLACSCRTQQDRSVDL